MSGKIIQESFKEFALESASDFVKQIGSGSSYDIINGLIRFDSGAEIKVTDKNLSKNKTIMDKLSKRIPVRLLDNDVVFIRHIKVPEDDQGKGYGRDAFNALIKLADKTKTLLYLEVQPFKNKPMDVRDLLKWYEKLGFTKFSHGRTPKMIRLPK